MCKMLEGPAEASFGSPWGGCGFCTSGGDKGVCLLKCLPRRSRGVFANLQRFGRRALTQACSSTSVGR